MFNAIHLTQQDGKTLAAVKVLEASALPEGDVTVDVEFSSLNYKDALAITGRGPIVRQWPMVPGIDFAGTVGESASPEFKAGDKVILTGWGVGEGHWGGLAQKARVPAAYLVAMPAGLTSRHAMAIGTAGLTAMLCVLAIERDIGPQAGEVLVTGANGGVGSFAVSLLARRGFRVVAATGRPQEAARLKALGAHEVIGREPLSAPGKPLQKERWAAVVDCVGSHTLANACAATKYGGVVAACGLAQGMDFPSTVAPFILRGVTLVGIDSVKAELPRRLEAWTQLQHTLGADETLAMTATIGLAQAIPAAQELIDGQVAGRLVVDVNAWPDPVDSLDRQLRYFLKIASLKSLSRAAEALDQTQPGLSRQLAALESCLGQPLFVRNGRGVELTEAGRGLKEKTEAAYRSIDAAVDCVRKHDGVSQGTVRVAAVHTLSYYLLGEVVARFSAECSDVALSLMCRSSSDAAELVENGKADIGLVYDTAVASQTLDTRPLFDDEMCLIATRDSAHGESIDLTEERPRLVAFPAHYALGKMVRQGSLKLPIVAEAETVDNLVRLVAAGMGACILPTRMPDKLLQDNDLRKIRIERPLMRRRVVVITRAGKPQSPLVQRLVDMVLAVVH